MADPVEIYLRDLRDIRSTGAAVKETSYYSPLANLFNEIGKTLKPKVRCIINLANRGAGLPDGGFFTPDQFQRASELEPLPGKSPSRPKDNFLFWSQIWLLNSITHIDCCR